MDAAREVAEGDLKKIPVRMKFFAVPGKKAQLKVACAETPGERSTYNVSVASEEAIEQAENRPADEGFVRDKLAKTGDTVYQAERIDVRLAGDCYLSASIINQMRRKALALLDEERLDMKRELVKLPDDLSLQLAGSPKQSYGLSSRLTQESDDLGSRSLQQTGGSCEGCGTYPTGEDGGMIVLPEITKGACDKEIEKKIIEGAYDGCSVKVNNLGWIAELRQHGAKVYGGKGLNVMNSAAAEVLGKAGVIVYEMSKELDEEPDRLMITEYDLPQKILKDGRCRVFEVVKENSKTVIKAQRS
jgi:hypothetical protein